CPMQSLSVWGIGITAVLLAVVDLRESRLNYVLASDCLGPCDRAGLDGFYWLRALGGVFFFVGTPALVIHLLAWIWNLGAIPWLEAGTELFQAVIILAAVFAVSLLGGFPGKSPPKTRSTSIAEKVVIF